MGARAVYQSLTLSIYFTRDDLDLLLSGRVVYTTLEAGGQTLTEKGACVSLMAAARSFLQLYVDAERQAIAEAKKAAMFTVDYETKAREGKRNAKKQGG